MSLLLKWIKWHLRARKRNVSPLISYYRRAVGVNKGRPVCFWRPGSWRKLSSVERMLPLNFPMSWRALQEGLHFSGQMWHLLRVQASLWSLAPFPELPTSCFSLLPWRLLESSCLPLTTALQRLWPPGGCRHWVRFISEALVLVSGLQLSVELWLNWSTLEMISLKKNKKQRTPFLTLSQTLQTALGESAQKYDLGPHQFDFRH